MKYQILLLSIVLILLGCSKSERDCICNLDDIPTVKTDSTNLQKEKTPIDIDLEGKLASKIKKAIDGEIVGKINFSLKEVELNKVVEVVSNEMPEHNDIMLFFRMKKLIYCEYYTRLCRDTSISSSELNKISNKKLEELDKAIENYFAFEANKENEPMPERVEVSRQQAFVLNPYDKLLVSFIEEKTGLKHSKNSFSYNIQIKSNGEIRPVNEKGTLYQYSGGKIEVTLNNNNCHLFEDLEVPQSMSLGNPKEPLKNSIQSKIEDIIKTNTEKIGTQIINCLQ